MKQIAQLKIYHESPTPYVYDYITSKLVLKGIPLILSRNTSLRDRYQQGIELATRSGQGVHVKVLILKERKFSIINYIHWVHVETGSRSIVKFRKCELSKYS